MTTVIFLHWIKPNYIVSYPVMYMYLMLYQYKGYFKNKGDITLYGIEDFLLDVDKKRLNKDRIDFNLSDDDLNDIYIRAVNSLFFKVKENKVFDGCIMIGFHPKGFDRLFSDSNYDLIKKKRIKTILWQDDLHAINKAHKKPEDEIVTDHRFDKVDLILTPSIRFYENLKHPYLLKSHYYFYCLNPSFYTELSYDNYFKRQSKILFSGARGDGYPMRAQIFKYVRQNKKNDKPDPNTNLADLIDVLSHPGYDRKKNKDKSGLAYYKILNNYRGAFFGFLAYPLNSTLAKIIEILFCGTLGFFEYSSELDRLGLVKFKHYVPIKLENDGKTFAKDINYYRRYLESKEGENIARQGCEFVRENYKVEYRANQLIKIIENMMV